MASADDILEAQLATNHTEVSRLVKLDPSYKSEYKRFVKWVTETPELATTRPPFITRANIDHYYSRVVAYHRGARNHIRRTVSALQKCSKIIELQWDFVMDSPVVAQALATQEVLEKTRVCGNPGTDPHKGLKDMLLEQEKVKLLTYVYRNRDD